MRACVTDAAAETLRALLDGRSYPVLVAAGIEGEVWARGL